MSATLSEVSSSRLVALVPVHRREEQPGEVPVRDLKTREK
jgi:hypothetical protein